MEEEIKAFTFYKNYYELIKHLSSKDRLELYDAIIKYMFEGEEPNLKGIKNGIWINIKMVLDNNKENIKKGKLNGRKGGAPIGNQNAKKTTQKQPKNNVETTQIQSKNNIKTTQKQGKNKVNNIYYLLFIISSFIFNNIKKDNNIYNKIYEWLEYKEERKEKYTEIGLKKLLTQIDKKIDEYGEQQVIDLIDECMASNYKGIIFDKLKKGGSNNKKSFLDIMKEEYDK